MFTSEMNDIPPVAKAPTPDILCEKPKITREAIEKIISKLNEEKSAGVDDLPPIVLKRTSKEISFPLQKIFTKSLDTGEIPSDWKTANVTPIFKKGQKKKPSNYRPISLTSQVCRIF